MTALIEARSLCIEYLTNQGILKLYGNGVSFDMNDGEFLAVLGGSGWGKSSLINLVLGMEKPTAGAIYFRGRDVTENSMVKRHSLARIAAVFQRPTSLPDMTIVQNLRLALSLAHVPRKDQEERIKEAISFFGLKEFSDAYPDKLSAGQRRRIDLARAIAVRPELLVLDEPSCDLDASATNLIMPLLRGLNKEHGTSIFMTTAIPRQAASATRSLHLIPPVIIAQEHSRIN